ncbi:DHS-like NAD/FAD-binding domain containing protein [Amanita muscaria]
MASDGCQIPQNSNNPLVLAQIRAFLDASEDVEIDRETLEDLFETLTRLQEAEEGTVTPENDSDVESEDDDAVEHSDVEIDITALYQRPDADAWTSREMAQLLKHLKERGMSSFVQTFVVERVVPIPKLLLAFGVDLCPELQSKRPSTLLYFLKVVLSQQLRLRDKLPQYNTIDDAVQLIHNSSRILILTGAGISVSCGIPDFRSKNGIYATLRENGAYGLDDPQQMFDVSYFRESPSVFYSFASKIYPSNFVPSPCHRFIKLVEDKGKLLRNYTQNIDTLETAAGVQRVLQCHGSFASASCLQCCRRVPGSEIEGDIMRHQVPLCTVCNTTSPSVPSSKGKKRKKKSKDKWDSDVEDESDVPEYPPGIMKPDITFFGEKLTDEFDRSLEADRERVDLLLIIGTSLKVAPVADILTHLPHSVPQILINKTPIRHVNPDIVLLGSADDIMLHFCNKLGWKLPPEKEKETPPSQDSFRQYPLRNSFKKRSSSMLQATREPRRVGNRLV